MWTVHFQCCVLLIVCFLFVYVCLTSFKLTCSVSKLWHYWKEKKDSKNKGKGSSGGKKRGTSEGDSEDTVRRALSFSDLDNNVTESSQ